MKRFDEEYEDQIGCQKGTESQVIGRVGMLFLASIAISKGDVLNRVEPPIEEMLTVQNPARDVRIPESRPESVLRGAIVTSHLLRIALKRFHSMLNQCDPDAKLVQVMGGL